jgi:hypothetical protein
MFSFKRFITFNGVCVFVLIALLPISIFGQQNSYTGEETKLQMETLIIKADSTEFGDNICPKIHEDEKNNYYALKLATLDSKYEKIRILELCYSSNELVHIGTDDKNNYYMFLVNKVLNLSDETINNKFVEFSDQSKEELNSLSNEQLRLWLLQYDKNSVK